MTHVRLFALVSCLIAAPAAVPAAAATVAGTVSDVTGAALPGARVTLRGVATGQESSLETGTDGRFLLDAPATGPYLVIVSRPGFSEAARVIVVTAADERQPLQGLRRPDLTTAVTPAGPLVQATNYADVRIHGLELAADAPVIIRPGVLTFSASGAFTRGTITRGINPLDGSALDGEPADNITPIKVLATARFTEPAGRWWVDYGVRTQTEVDPITPTLLTSPFRIAQDLLSLEGFTVQRLGWGIDLTRGADRLALNFAIENLSNTFYREHFQSHRRAGGASPSA